MNCENVENGFMVSNINNARNILFSWGKSIKSWFYDSLSPWATGDFYGSIHCACYSGNLFCCANVYKSTNIYYSFYLNECSYCLGCIWLKNKSFCILNKQYSKEDWFKKANEIFETLMGGDVAPRKKFIQNHAKYAKNIDI